MPAEKLASRLFSQLLASDRFVAAVQEVVSRTLAARGAVDQGLKKALSSLNLPTTADVEELRGRLDDLDRLMTDLDRKLTRIENRLSGEPPAAKKPRKAV